MNRVKKALKFLLFLAIAFLPSLGAVAVKTGGWYEELNKPLWNPPSWVFGPVWTLLYIMIGLAGYFAWTHGGRQDRRAIFTVYGVQLFLNALWTPVFFGLQRPDWALAILIFLWFMVLLCLSTFTQRSRLAAWLMAPYFLWISFAGGLNAAIMVIN